jgi:hypothetical protein
MTETPYKASESIDAHLQYRSLSRAAVGSVAMFLLGLTGLLFWQLLILPIAGLMLGLSAIRTIKRYPLEYSGLNVARVGMVLCTLLLAAGGSLHAYLIATEVPEQYKDFVISFSELQPEGIAVQHLPKRAMELQGKEVFIRGYMHPGVAGMGPVNEFVLVPDMGTCCFGGQPRPTDMILVHTTRDARLTYAPRIVRLGGKFGIGDHPESFAGVDNVVYQLQAEYSK